MKNPLILMPVGIRSTVWPGVIATNRTTGKAVVLFVEFAGNVKLQLPWFRSLESFLCPCMKMKDFPHFVPSQVRFWHCCTHCYHHCASHPSTSAQDGAPCCGHCCVSHPTAAYAPTPPATAACLSRRPDFSCYPSLPCSPGSCHCPRWCCHFTVCGFYSHTG